MMRAYPENELRNVKGAKMETYLTVEELAEYLKLSQQTIRRWIRGQEIPFHRIMNVIRFRLSEIDAWVEGTDVLHGISEVGNNLELFANDKGGDV